MDYIFTPIIADRVVMESSIKFATVINEQMISTGKSGIKGIYLVWNLSLIHISEPTRRS